MSEIICRPCSVRGRSVPATGWAPFCDSCRTEIRARRAADPHKYDDVPAEVVGIFSRRARRLRLMAA